MYLELAPQAHGSFASYQRNPIPRPYSDAESGPRGLSKSRALFSFQRASLSPRRTTACDTRDSRHSCQAFFRRPRTKPRRPMDPRVAAWSLPRSDLRDALERASRGRHVEPPPLHAVAQPEALAGIRTSWLRWGLRLRTRPASATPHRASRAACGS